MDKKSANPAPPPPPPLLTVSDLSAAAAATATATNNNNNNNNVKVTVRVSEIEIRLMTVKNPSEKNDVSKMPLLELGMFSTKNGAINRQGWNKLPYFCESVKYDANVLAQIKKLNGGQPDMFHTNALQFFFHEPTQQAILSMFATSSSSSSSTQQKKTSFFSAFSSSAADDAPPPSPPPLPPVVVDVTKGGAGGNSNAVPPPTPPPPPPPPPADEDEEDTGGVLTNQTPNPKMVKRVENNMMFLCYLLFPTRLEADHAIESSYYDYVTMTGINVWMQTAIIPSNPMPYFMMGGNTVSITRAVWLNDLINEPVFYDTFFKTLKMYQQWKIAQWPKLVAAAIQLETETRIWIKNKFDQASRLDGDRGVIGKTAAPRSVVSLFFSTLTDIEGEATSRNMATLKAKMAELINSIEFMRNIQKEWAHVDPSESFINIPVDTPEQIAQANLLVNQRVERLKPLYDGLLGVRNIIKFLNQHRLGQRVEAVRAKMIPFFETFVPLMNELFDRVIKPYAAFVVLRDDVKFGATPILDANFFLAHPGIENNTTNPLNNNNKNGNKPPGAAAAAAAASATANGQNLLGKRSMDYSSLQRERLSILLSYAPYVKMFKTVATDVAKMIPLHEKSVDLVNILIRGKLEKRSHEKDADFEQRNEAMRQHQAAFLSENPSQMIRVLGNELYTSLFRINVLDAGKPQWRSTVCLSIVEAPPVSAGNCCEKDMVLAKLFENLWKPVPNPLDQYLASTHALYIFAQELASGKDCLAFSGKSNFMQTIWSKLTKGRLFSSSSSSSAAEAAAPPAAPPAAPLEDEDEDAKKDAKKRK